MLAVVLPLPLPHLQASATLGPIWWWGCYQDGLWGRNNAIAHAHTHTMKGARR